MNDNGLNKRLIQFAGSTLAIEYSGAAPTRVVEFLYSDLPSVVDGEPDYTINLTPDEETGELCLHAEDRQQRFKTEGELAVQLIGETCYQLAYYSHGGLVMHAACMRVNGLGALLPGRTGSGKSTLTAWLSHQGFDYLTDELVFIPDGDNYCFALTRPLNLKQSARAILRGELSIPEGDHAVLSSPGVDMVPPRLLGPGEVLNATPLDFIIFPHYTQHGELNLKRLSKAQAGFGLMECLINARNLPEHGLPEVVRLVGEVPAFQVQYNEFAQVQSVFRSIIR